MNNLLKVGLLTVNMILVSSLRAENEQKKLPFVNSVGMTLCPIPAGSFIRGTDDGFWEERPAHKVTVSTPFYAASTPVTNKQYELYDPSHKLKRRHSPFCHHDDDPVIFVTFAEAKAYCEWLSAKEKRLYRLPTEAEWEWAMRGGVSTDYLTGDELPEAYQRNNKKMVVAKQKKPI